MRRYLSLSLPFDFFALMLLSCKSKAVVVKEGKAKGMLSSDTIVKKHYGNRKDFSTLYIKSSAHYEDPNQSQNVTAENQDQKRTK